MSAAINIVDIGTHIDLFTEIHGHGSFQLFFFVRTTAGGGVQNVGIRNLCVVEISVFRRCDIVIVGIGEDKIACFLPFGEYFSVCRCSQVSQVTDGERFTFHQCRVAEIQLVRIQWRHICLTQGRGKPIGGYTL